METAVDRRGDAEEFLHRAPVMLHCTDSRGRMVDANALWLDTFGYSLDRVIGCRFSDLLMPGSRTQLRQWLANLDPSRAGTGGFEAELIDATGRPRPVRLRVSCSSPAADLYYWAVSEESNSGVTECTCTERGDRALEEERQRLYSLLDTLPAYVHLQTPEYLIKFANRYFKEHIGDWEGRTCYESFHGRRDPCPNCPADRVLLEGGFDKREWRNPNGRIYQVYDYPFTDTDGSPLVLELGIDITDRKRAEEALRASEERLRMIVNNAPIAIVAMNREGTLTFADGLGLKAVGLEPQRAVGRPVDEVFAHLPAFARHARRSLAGEETSSVIDVGEAVLETRYVPVCDAGCRVIGSIGVAMDVTERVRAEREMARLEHQLRQSQKLQAIGTLAGGVAHDFNNILMAVIGYSELALACLENGNRSRGHIEQVLRASLRARSLVQQILSFSRPAESPRTPVDLQPILNETLKLLRATVPSGLELRQRVSADNCPVLADSTQIHQLIMNLCSNAADAMEASGGILEVVVDTVDVDEAAVARISGELTPGRYTRLSVMDTGHGMDEETLGRIFEPFFTTKPVGRGTGMGLTVVQGIVQGHGGAIAVDSSPGRGTTVEVFLPAFAGDAKKALIAEVDALPGGSERILFVDDEQVLINLTEQTLTMLGYRVTTRSGGWDALELFQSRPEWFDLVIADHSMPDMPGRELAERISSIRPQTPIILYTGFGDEVALTKDGDTAIRAVLNKPILKQDLARAIRRVLDAGRAPLEPRNSRA